ncbi:MAG TPA: Clp protease N-terminal domain-containing protein [Ktedonobacterales bacterium]|nr:Clp protease N-terminal domain-containing protein [Ktedonobacterales bacterium]
MRGRGRRDGRGRRWVAASVAIYRLLLWAYPASFRREWCRDMAQLFGDCCRDGYRAGRVGGLARVWLVALADLTRSIPRERLSRVRRPGRQPRNRHIRLALAAIGRQARPRRARHAPGDALAPLFHLRWLKHLLRRRGRHRPPPWTRPLEPHMMQDQFDRFTERARRVLAHAQEEARRFNHNYMGTEHLLLGLLRDPESLAARVLGDLGVSLERARQGVEFIIGRGDRVIAGEIGLTPRAKRVIELAVDEARRLGHHYVGTEHLLLGLIREGEGIAAGVLESLGVNLERARDATLRRLGEG